MPDALIVTDERIKDPKKILKMLVRKGILRRASVGGVQVWGRHYLTTAALRDAYVKRLNRRN
jgi:hypothetical protein